MTVQDDAIAIKHGAYVLAVFDYGNGAITTYTDFVQYVGGIKILTVSGVILYWDETGPNQRLTSVKTLSPPLTPEPDDGSFGILENGHKFVIKNRHLSGEKHCMVIYSTEGRGWDWYHWSEIYDKVVRIWDTEGTEGLVWNNRIR